MSGRLAKELARAAAVGMQAAAQRNDTSLSVDTVAANQPAIVSEVAQAIERSPELQHVTNSEPWYQSRVTWGAVVAILSGILPLAGITIDQDDQAMLMTVLVAAGSAFGGAFALYGRWKAKKPLGAK